VTRSCENFTRLTLSVAAANADSTQNVYTLKDQVADYYALTLQSQSVQVFIVLGRRNWKPNPSRVNTSAQTLTIAEDKLAFSIKKCIIVQCSFSRISGDTLVKGSFWIGLRAGGH
jgi:hypothetical protein